MCAFGKLPSMSAVVRTCYKECLRSCMRVRSIMRPAHVVLVSKALGSFAEQQQLTSLRQAIKTEGPLMHEGVIRQAFRNSPPAEQSASIDASFRALRALASLEIWVQSNNSMYDSLEGLSDREGGSEPSMSVVVRELLRESAPAGSHPSA